MTFTIPEEVAHKLKDSVAERRRSAFVATAVGEKLKDMESEAIKRGLIEGYIERYEEDRTVGSAEVTSIGV